MSNVTSTLSSTGPVLSVDPTSILAPPTLVRAADLTTALQTSSNSLVESVVATETLDSADLLDSEVTIATLASIVLDGTEIPIQASESLTDTLVADAVQVLVATATEVLSAATTHTAVLESLKDTVIPTASGVPARTLFEFVADVVRSLPATTAEVLSATAAHDGGFEAHAEKLLFATTDRSTQPLTDDIVADSIRAITGASSIAATEGLPTKAAHTSKAMPALFSLQVFLNVLTAAQASDIYKTVMSALDFWLKAQVIHLVTGGLGGVPKKFSDVLRYWLNRRAIVITYRNTDPLFDQISAWMVSHPEWRNQQAYYASSDDFGRQKDEVITRILPGFKQEEDEAKTSEAKLSPALDFDYGLPFGKYELIIRKSLVQK